MQYTQSIPVQENWQFKLKYNNTMTNSHQVWFYSEKVALIVDTVDHRCVLMVWT